MTAQSARPISITDHRASAQLSVRERVLDDTRAHITKYVSVTDAQADVLAIWVAHTHAIEAADCTPYIHVTSTGPRAGKTRLLEVLEPLVRAPIRTADMTEAALFHLLSTKPRTLLLDEVDTVFGGGKSREGLRALLNASYRRGTPVQRVRGGKVESYEVFGPKVIAGIGEIPDTVADRSIRIQMVRKESDVKVERYNYRDAEWDADMLKRRAADVFSPNAQTVEWLKALVVFRPELPDWLNDRQQDSWEPLLALVDMVGGHWPKKVRDASYQLSRVDWVEEIRN